MSHQGKIPVEDSFHELLEVFRICKDIHCALLPNSLIIIMKYRRKAFVRHILHTEVKYALLTLTYTGKKNNTIYAPQKDRTLIILH